MTAGKGDFEPIDIDQVKEPLQKDIVVDVNFKKKKNWAIYTITEDKVKQPMLQKPITTARFYEEEKKADSQKMNINQFS